MEFRYRAVDDRPPLYFSPSSTAGYFSLQALRATNYQTIDPRQNPELMQKEMVQREIEKQRIREEIIADEIARRRELEAEVWRELMMEREMAMRTANEGENFDNRRLEELLPFPWKRSRWISESMAVPQVKPALEGKLIVLAKPDQNLCGAKRKAMASPTRGAADLLNGVWKKTPMEEWSCALCQVSATSESGLNEHLQGKKHKAKEERLRENKMAKNATTLQTSKRAALLKLEPKAKGESLQLDKTENDPVEKGKKEGAKGLKKCKRVKRMEREERTEEFRMRKKFKLWCETCRIGAYSHVVMEAHQKGRKHLAQLQEACQIVPGIASSTNGAEDEAKESNPENVKNNETVTEAVADNEKTKEYSIADDANGAGQFSPANQLKK